MAIGAGGGGDTGLRGLRMRAVLVGGLSIWVTLRAGDFLRRRVVRQGFDVGMAIDAGKHCAVNGVLHPGRIHEEAMRLSVDIDGQASVAMAGEAILVLELVLCRESDCPGKKSGKYDSRQKGMSRIHGNTMRRRVTMPP